MVKDLLVKISASIAGLKKGLSEAVTVTQTASKKIDQSAKQVGDSLNQAFSGQYRQNIEQLNEAISTQRTRINGLKTALQAAQKAQQKYKKGSPQWEASEKAVQAYKKAIRSATVELDKLNIKARENKTNLAQSRLAAEDNSSAMEALSRVTTSLTGALLLLGDGNEKLQPIMKGVRISVAALNAVVAIQNLRLRENQIFTNAITKAQTLWASATKGTTAAMTGLKSALLGIGIGAAIAGIVMIISKMNEIREKTNEAKKAQEEFVQEYAKISGEGLAKTKTLIATIDNTSLSLNTRKKALKDLKSEFPEYFKNLNDEDILTGKVKISTEKLTSAIIANAKARALQSAIANKSKKQLELEDEIRQNQIALAKEQREYANLTYSSGDASEFYSRRIEQLQLDIKKSTAEYFKLNNEIANYLNKIQDLNKETDIVIGVDDTETENIDKAIKKVQQLLSVQEKAQIAEVKLQGEKNLQLKKTDEERVRTAFITQNRLLDIQEQFAEQKLALNKNDESAQLEYQTTIDGINQQRLINESNLNNELLKIKNKAISDDAQAEKNRAVALQESFQGTLDVYDRFYDQEETAVKNRYADGLTSEKEYLNQLNQLTLERLQARLAIYKAFGMDVGEIEKQIADLRIKINGDTNKIIEADVKRFTRVVQNAFNGLANGLANALTQGFEAIASGKGDITDLFKGMLGAVADFLQKLGSGLIAAAIATQAFYDTLVANPALALVAGAAAIAAGAALKATLNEGVAFADGGIVSGPTLGLVGEYPGASTNPEVIAPLNKLKSMLNVDGQGGGFIAETRISGRDLAIVLNRYNNDAKRI